MEYRIQFNYTVSKEIEVEADSPEEAIEMANEEVDFGSDVSDVELIDGLVTEDDETIGTIDSDCNFIPD